MAKFKIYKTSSIKTKFLEEYVHQFVNDVTGYRKLKTPNIKDFIINEHKKLFEKYYIISKKHNMIAEYIIIKIKTR